MNNLTLSVIVPTYNRADRLKASLQNYLQSDRSDIEFIVIDNNSNDNTSEVVHHFMQTDKRVRYIRNPSNIGPNRSLFRAFLNAKAPLVMILPDDDSITKGFINLVIQTFERNPTVGIVHSELDPSERNAFSAENSNRGRFLKKGIEALSFTYMHSGAIPGIAFRQEAIDYDAWKLDDSIYPQVRISCNIALRYGVYFISSQTEYVTVGMNDNVLVRSKGRPLDYGVHERVNIALDVVKRLSRKEQLFAYHRITAGLFGWASGVFFEFYKLDRKRAFIYLRALLNHSYIKSSLIFWGLFAKTVLFTSPVTVIDKIVITSMMMRSIVFSIFNPNIYQSLQFITAKLAERLSTKFRLKASQIVEE